MPAGYSGRSRNPDFNATNELGTCLWCGAKLRRYRYADEPWAKERFGDPVPLGSHADGAFCGLRCGYNFGVMSMRLGQRFFQRETR